MIFSAGLAVAQWLVCGVRFLPGNPELVTLTQEFIPSSVCYLAGYGIMTIVFILCLVRKNTGEKF